MKAIGKIIKKKEKGILYYGNGDRLIGDYLDDKPKGKHALFLKNGLIISRNFSLDDLIMNIEKKEEEKYNSYSKYQKVSNYQKLK